MARRPSLLPPPSSAPRKRSGHNGPPRPLRVELIAALLIAIVVIAIPLYLWRRPAAMNADTSLALPAASTSALAADAGPSEADLSPKVALGTVRTLKCVDAKGAKTPPERCDRLAPLEQALTEAIRKNARCAPVSTREATLNFVLTVDFAEQKLHLWPGQSGNLRRPKANELLRCVMRDLPEPDWSTLPHQHRRYEIGVLATYRP